MSKTKHHPSSSPTYIHILTLAYTACMYVCMYVYPQATMIRPRRFHPARSGCPPPRRPWKRTPASRGPDRHYGSDSGSPRPPCAWPPRPPAAAGATPGCPRRPPPTEPARPRPRGCCCSGSRKGVGGPGEPRWRRTGASSERRTRADLTLQHITLYTGVRVRVDNRV